MDIKVIKYPMISNNEKSDSLNLDMDKKRMTKAVVFGNIILMNAFNASPSFQSTIANNNFTRQLFTCLDKISLELKEIGSSIRNVCKLMILLKDMKAIPLMWKGMNCHSV